MKPSQLFPSLLRCSLTCLGQTALKATTTGDFLGGQQLRLRVSTAGGAGSIPGQGTKISHVLWHGQHIKKKNKTNKKHNYCHRSVLLRLYFSFIRYFPFQMLLGYSNRLCQFVPRIIAPCSSLCRHCNQIYHALLVQPVLSPAGQ